MSAVSIFLLTACSAQKDVADPSADQEKAAELAYIDIRDGKYDEFLSHLDPKLQTYFQENTKLMKSFSRDIPQGEYKSKNLMVKHFSEASDKPSEYKLSYEIAYPDNLVQYDVSFDRPSGSDKIQDLNIRVFGK